MPIRRITPALPLVSAAPSARSSDSLEAGSEQPSPDNGAERDAPPHYVVGYRRPPLHSRFKPGQSGNPRGRTRAAKGLKTIARETLTQKVAVRTASGEKKISRIEALLHKTTELAMKGNPRALAEVLKLYAAAVPEVTGSADASVEDLSSTDLAVLAELQALLGQGGEP